jgi:hypothetical protein
MQTINTAETTPTTPTISTILTAVKAQLKLEMSLGLNERDITEETKSLLLQKYGLVAPQLTNSEIVTIRCEEEKYARRAA